jgi:alcohol dehydrogenase
MKIRAAVLEEAGRPRPYADSKPISVGEIELDGPGAGEVLVQIKGAGVCHSDLSTLSGVRPRPLPLLLGHEAAGIVAETGPGVDDFKQGDHVVMSFVPFCGDCLPCHEGRPQLCEPGSTANGNGTLLGGSRHGHRDDGRLYHHSGVSGFGEYSVVSRRSLIKIDPEIPLSEAAMFGCAVMTGVGSVVNTAGLEPGTTAAVVGLGGVGLNALLGAIASGARRIIAIDLNDEKLALARQLGATDTINPADEGAVEHVRDLTSGGVDYGFETAGAVAALETAYKVTRRGGTTVTCGISPPDATMALNHINLVGEERTLKGSYMGSCVPRRDIPRYLELFRAGKLPVDRLLSARITLDDINLAMDRLADGKAIRQIIEF